MAINPLNENHRQRLARAVEYSHQELRRYAALRDNTIRAYLGVSGIEPDFNWNGNERVYKDSLPKGNLLQIAGLSHQVALAYGEPQFLVTARTPEQTGLAEKLQHALNRMSALLNLGEIARNIAADSYFGYGIYKCGVGRMPLSAQAATGLEVGPCIWRVSQDNFIYDINAQDWDSVAYVGDNYPVSLEDAIEDYPEHAEYLTAMTSDADRFKLPHVMPKPGYFHSPQEELWLFDVYFPAARVVATWPIRNETFGELSNVPLAVRDYEGHWSGIYQVLNHLYSPDEIVPVAQAESIKAMHFAFDEILHLTIEQARNAKINPTYRVGGPSERDMLKLWDATDRHPVGITAQSEMGFFEVPGPSQPQTQYLGALYNFFREFNPIMDDPAKAPTATQGTLERQTTNAVVSEAKRKFNRALQLVGYKLGHLLLNNNQIILPASSPLRPGSNVMVDMTWAPEPRGVRIDDFDIGIEPYSTQHRTPEQRLSTMLTLNQQIATLFQLQAMGASINVEQAINDMAELAGEPRIKGWYEEADPMYSAKKSNSRISAPRMGVGQYVRRNVSEKTTAGQLQASLNDMGAENGRTTQT